MEQPIPKWLDADFMAQCLRNEKDNQNIVVKIIDASLAVPVGNNYGACVVRVKLEYKDNKNDKEQHQLSLIVKSEVTEGAIKDILDDFDDDVKFREPAFYKKFLPQVKKITNADFAPKTIFSPKYEVTVLEDLKEQGFVMADRLKQLDFEHCRLYMEAAAAFHASSFAVHKHDPQLVEKLGEPIDFSKFDFFLIMTKLAFQCFTPATEKIEKFKKYHKPIEDLADKLWDLVKDAQMPHGVFSTLTQGDPWTTNMMFKYDHSGRVCEVKLLDFQALRYTSPVNDILFFLWTSATHEVRQHKTNDLYRIYLDSLNRKLEELECSERITYDIFMNEVRRMSPVTFHLAAVLVPLFVDSEPINFTIFLQREPHEVNPYDKYYNETYCRDSFPKYLEQLELAGVFDYIEQHHKQ